jgi:hypothetical protein
LGDGPPYFLRGFTCPAVLWMCQLDSRVSHTRLSLSVAPLSSSVLLPLAFARLSAIRLDTP